MIYSTFGKGMLSREVSKDGRKFRKLPFRKDLKHDRWQQSEAAIAVGKRWDEVRKSGGKTSFTEDNPTS